jgi:hypothetical protein
VLFGGIKDGGERGRGPQLERVMTCTPSKQTHILMDKCVVDHHVQDVGVKAY